MQLSNEEITELQKFKQHLQLLGKQACQRPGDKTCVDIPDQSFCASCYANAVLQTSDQTVQTGEPFYVHMDPVATEPEMVLGVERLDNLYPLITPEGDRPGVACQELLLRFMGVMIEAFGETEQFRVAAEKFGMKFYLKQ